MGELAKMMMGIDTSDATATAADILTAKTAYVNGAKLTGTLTKSGAYAYAILTTRIPISSDNSTNTIPLNDLDDTFHYANDIQYIGDTPIYTKIHLGSYWQLINESMTNSPIDLIGKFFYNSSHTYEGYGLYSDGTNLIFVQTFHRPIDSTVYYVDDVAHSAAYDSSTQTFTFPVTIA